MGLVRNGNVLKFVPKKKKKTAQKKKGMREDEQTEVGKGDLEEASSHF